ncbi:helix-turn-helix transcriptional regulator [Streptomyces sp. t39]|uniref:helix-turn-helix transcriptional regulator n=1 Tax=Streptomyces sp. t39 TaxID=1828156 RepID=UPI0021C5938A|nr:AAA family ATPase [Streptomyces sp. t39]
MVLAERSGETSRLRQVFSDVDGGRGRIVVVSGPAGSGRTALLREAVDGLAVPVTLLSAHCSRAEQNLPLGVIRQLFTGAALGPERARHVADLLRRGAQQAEAVADEESAHIGPADAAVAEELWSVVVEISARTPVGIVVDDIRHADAHSLAYLLYFIRRSHTVRTAMVFVESDEMLPVYPLFQDELHQRTDVHYIRLSLLSRAGISAILRERLGHGNSSSVVDSCAEVTGGNPLLVRAFAADVESIAPGTPVSAGEAVGDAFRQAVTLCLRRSGAEALEAARVLALLGDRASPALVGRTLDIGPRTADRLLALLRSTGLVADGGFRHPAVRAAVLAQTPEAVRTGLESRIARVLYDSGAPSPAVAAFLTAAPAPFDVADERWRWAVPVLRDAAELAAAENRVPQATAYLEQAHRAASGGCERSAILVALARLQRRSSPRAALRRLDPVVAHLTSGRFDAAHAAVMVRCLLQDGRHDEARELLRRLDETDGGRGPAAASKRLLGLWLSVSYPGVARGLSADAAPWQSARGPESDGDALRWRATRLLASVLGGAADERSIQEAEQALRIYHVTEHTLEPLTLALSALVYADRAGTASAWCSALLAEAGLAHAPAWRAQLSSLAAQAALRQGMLPDAERYAAAALSGMTAGDWGAEIGAPLATAVLTHLAVGRPDDAGTLLQRPVPAEMHDGRGGLHYRYARGRYCLHTSRPHAALRDFLDCGVLMQRWRMDAPGLVPWRSGAAEALARIGETVRARRLVAEELDMLRAGTPGRSYGVALRTLAAVSRPEQRPEILKEAVDVLRACGDRYELAATLVDIADAHEALGESKRARYAARRARGAAESCGAHGLLARLRPPGTGPAASEAAAGGEPALPGGAELSTAEGKVAALAAMGYSNRDIGRKLHITVSTVEQHLTRVYRKLNVSRRQDLPAPDPRLPVALL